MISSRRSRNSWISGIKPRTFFGGRMAMINMEARTNKGGLEFNPDWAKKELESKAA